MLSINTAAHIVGAILLSTLAGIGIASDTVGDMRANAGGIGAPAIVTTVACLKCGDRKRGYEWASSQKTSSLEACGNAPWEFRRGCDDYLADVRGT